MANDDPTARLTAQGATSTPAAEAGFADRLEAHLRHEHAQRHPQRRKVGAVLPRLGLALVLAIAGIAGVIALTGRDAGVPVEVVQGELVPPADQPPVGDPDSQNPIDVSPTPTVQPESTIAPAATSVVPPDPTTTPMATLVPVEPTPTVLESTDSPPTVAATPTATVAPTSTPLPTATVEPVAVETPSPVPAEPTPTAPTLITPTAITPTPTTPSPVPTATTVPEPTPTVTPEPVAIELVCEVRESQDQVGVVCTWNEATVDGLAQYRVLRSLNGADAQVVSRQRAAADRNYVDRAVSPGDQVIYLVRGLSADDQVLAASVRQVVSVP